MFSVRGAEGDVGIIVTGTAELSFLTGLLHELIDPHCHIILGTSAYRALYCMIHLFNKQ